MLDASACRTEALRILTWPLRAITPKHLPKSHRPLPDQISSDRYGPPPAPPPRDRRGRTPIRACPRRDEVRPQAGAEERRHEQRPPGYISGLDLGQAQDHTALAVLELTHAP